MTVFLSWPFAATGGTVTRTLPNRLADTVNVKDYGAVGDGTGDDGPAIQAAIDAAFGSSGSPHATSSTLNRVLRIPHGDYPISSPLVLTDVVGGQIVGDGAQSTRLVSSGSILTVNGCVNSYISGFSTSCGGVSTSNGRYGIKLAVGPSVGLQNVTLADVEMGAAQYGLRVGATGVGGDNVVLLYCQFGELDIACSIEGATAHVNFIAGQIFTSNTGIKVLAGNLTCNNHFVRTFSTGYDIVHSSSGISTVFGIRTESSNCIKCTDGTVVAISVVHQGSGASVDCTSPGKVQAIGCMFGQPGTPSAGYITGTGDVFLRNVVFGNSDPIHMSSFTGKICECVTGNTFTFAQLPPAIEGLTLNLSNANTATWGANITTTGANHVLARYNGSNWTVVGK